VNWENGQAGYGFIELGFGVAKSNDKRPFALNFDVLAHEMGHIILASEVGMPMNADPTQYAGFQEAASDILALISLLHFESFSNHLLKVTHGNLYAPNELNRLAELSDTEQIRTACHSIKMTDVEYAWTPARFLTQKQIHKLGQPFTAAIFDILVEVFQESLVDRGAITRELDDQARGDLSDEADRTKVQEAFDAAYEQDPAAFASALLFARDFMGERLVKSWKRLDVDTLTLWTAAVSFLTVDRALTGTKYQEIIRECFRWRHFEP
jgi:Zn-dependent peptidase ImmA (M78 family)